MPDAAYATFIEDCRREQASLIGLIEALQGKTIQPGAPMTIPGHLAAATQATLGGFQRTVADLNALIDAYDVNPDS